MTSILLRALNYVKLILSGFYQHMIIMKALIYRNDERSRQQRGLYVREADMRQVQHI